MSRRSSNKAARGELRKIAGEELQRHASAQREPSAETADVSGRIANMFRCVQSDISPDRDAEILADIAAGKRRTSAPDDTTDADTLAAIAAGRRRASSTPTRERKV
ncbi:MAG TPA: hypothetical protein VGF43_20295 [Dongiaceae bacterium]|jgi:hypothetical protein